MDDGDISKLRSRLTLLARRLRKEAQSDEVSWSRMLIVGLIDRMGGRVTPTMLSAAESMSSANVAALLRDLEAQRLITRTPDEQDRRKVWIALSDEGKNVLSQSRKTREKWLETAMQATLTADEQKQLLEASELIERIALFDRG
ncbi:MarR family winged helix-turn-helix transcriptional regulator [Agrobacterium tumefaciens]|uniref:MarR family winged helix-turn-helix transcriptional regulator n=1 Tax=Agrobacterium tumefaciens TaxID=358 RepID=UPI0021CE459F|nr:MarR family transcriptional regulator [Agrobacterium tumefaciens]